MTPLDILKSLEGSPLGKCIDYHIDMYAYAWKLHKSDIRSINARSRGDKSDTPDEKSLMWITLEFPGSLFIQCVYNPGEWEMVNF